MYAAEGGHLDVVKLLMELGAEVNAKNDEDGKLLSFYFILAATPLAFRGYVLKNQIVARKTSLTIPRF